MWLWVRVNPAKYPKELNRSYLLWLELQYYSSGCQQKRKNIFFSNCSPSLLFLFCSFKRRMYCHSFMWIYDLKNPPRTFFFILKKKNCWFVLLASTKRPPFLLPRFDSLKALLNKSIVCLMRIKTHFFDINHSSLQGTHYYSFYNWNVCIAVHFLFSFFLFFFHSA